MNEAAQSYDRDSTQDTSSSRRDTFLLEWYGLLWSNIDRSMRGIWNILGTITIIGTIAAAIHKEYLPVSLGAFLGFLVLYWAMNMKIDLNSWHRRNLIFLTAVERQFLDACDYGKIIPKKYLNPSAKWITFYKINLWTFVIFTLCFAMYIFGAEHSSQTQEEATFLQRYGHWTAFLVGAGVSLYNAYVQGKSARLHRAELFEGQDVGSCRSKESGL